MTAVESLVEEVAFQDELESLPSLQVDLLAPDDLIARSLIH